MLFTPLPPDTTILAVVKSGLLLSLFYSFTKDDFYLYPFESTSSVAAELLPDSRSEKADGLIVKKSTAYSDFTLAKAFPA